MDYLEYQQVMLAENAGLIFLCICGAFLNAAMLFVLSTKKQVRASVYTAYMIQIALTDLLVCAVWLIITCVLTAEMRNTETSSVVQEYVPNHTEDGDTVNDTLPDFQQVFSSNGGSSPEEQASEDSVKFRVWRVLYTVYNFHYYTNIFLLASMSVERCAAVWKSLRCQRYQYNRKSIYTVSIIVWILSLGCVLPSFINLDLVLSDSESSHTLRWVYSNASQTDMAGTWNDIDPLSRVFKEPSLSEDQRQNFTDLTRDFDKASQGVNDLPGSGANLAADDNSAYRTDMEILYECYLLLWRAKQQNRECATDYAGISITECLHIIGTITAEYSGGDEYKNYDDDEYMEYGDANYGGMVDNKDDLSYPNDDLYGYYAGNEDTNLPFPSNDASYIAPIGGDYQSVLSSSNNSICINRDFYQHLLVEAVNVLVEHYRKKNVVSEWRCDPQLSNGARAYVIAVNLVIGFFIPFVIIVVSYVSIAYMIGKRANSRMKPDTIDTGYTNGHYNYNFNSQLSQGKANNSETMKRRMTNFLRNMMGASFASETKSDWDESEVKSGGSMRMPLSPTSSAAGSKRKIFLKNTHDAASSNSMHGCNVKNETHLKFPSIMRTKKYSFGHDVATEHIPQTIAEHPHESDESADNNYVISEPRAGQSHQSTPQSYTPPNHRESGGSYASSVESFPTEQTSVNDKRLSGSTMLAATPPTPLNYLHSPTVNEFFPNEGPRPEQQALMQGSACDANNPATARPSLYRFYSVDPQCSTDADATHQLQRANDKQTNHDLPHKVVQKTKRKGHGAYEESSLNGNSNNSNDFCANSKLTLHDESGKLVNGKMIRSQSAPIKENQRASGLRVASLRRGTELNPNGSDGHLHNKYNRQTSTSSFVNFFRGRTNSNTSSKSSGNTMRKTVVRKNAERHLRVSRTVLAYVTVFALCWLPQRIVYLLYVVEGLHHVTSVTCLKLLSSTRVISFITVLLNPIVYVATQRELRAYMRQWFRKSKLFQRCCGLGKTLKRRKNNPQPPPGTWTNQNNREDEVANNDTSQYGQPLVSLNSDRNTKASKPSIRLYDAKPVHEQPLLHKINFSEEELKKQDVENKNWIERSIDSENIKSSNNSSKSNNSSSGKEDFFFSKSENIEEFWMRWLQEKQYASVNTPQEEEDNSSSAAAKVLAKMSEEMNETTI